MGIMNLFHRENKEPFINRYGIEYFILPTLIEKYKKKEITLEKLMDRKYFIKFAESHYEEIGMMLDWNQPKITVNKVDDDHIAICYEFPFPIASPDALYGLVYVNDTTRECDYYTFEMETEKDWAIGSFKFINGSPFHTLHTFYNGDDTSIENFIQQVKQIRAKNE